VFATGRNCWAVLGATVAALLLLPAKADRRARRRAQGRESYDDGGV